MMRKGLRKFEEVSFNIDGADLRAKLPRETTKSTTGPRKSSRKLKGNPRRGVEAPSSRDTGGSVEIQHGETSSGAPVAVGLTANGASRESSRTDYLWVDYRLEVRFQGVLMQYKLECPETQQSRKGEVSLAPILDPWSAED